MTQNEEKRPRPPEGEPEPEQNEKPVLGSQRSGSTRKNFLRELKRAARGRLDKRSPQD
jgi:hypothetical protein